ncbi:MAG: D-alanine--D-alanine ligase family protein [Bacillota bacterium]|nr:D-alanine--D-alanine ligase family protein [Bacillota bacterium]
MGKKLSLLILFGGVSSEHEVSCVSAASVLDHIDSGKYEINTIGITKEGNWFLTSSPAVHIRDGSWERDSGNRRAVLSPDRSIKGFLAEKDDGSFEVIRTDVVFPVLHGRNGEDGTMQGLLQIAGIPFVGSDAAASAASMDKAVTKAMVQQAGGVTQALCDVVHRKDFDKAPAKEAEAVLQFFDGNLPLFVKPANAGSSVGISKVKKKEELEAALRLAFDEDDKVLVEETIEGREIEVAVLGNEEPEASCIGEIFAANEFYDYNAKYENDKSETGIVRDLSTEKEREIRDKAIKVYRIMGCRGLARVDFFLKPDGTVVFNELNTLPGFTHISMYPKLWEESGLPYSQLIDRLIMLAMDAGSEIYR